MWRLADYILVRDSSLATRGAGDGIKSRTPAEMLGWGPRPGVERSETPGPRSNKTNKAREAADRRLSNVSFIELDAFAFRN